MSCRRSGLAHDLERFGESVLRETAPVFGGRAQQAFAEVGPLRRLRCVGANRLDLSIEELADVVIYALEFANITGLDVAAVIEAKMAANAKKYPVEKSRGRSDKYTEL